MKTDQVFLLSASMGLGLLLVIVSVVLLAVLAKPGMRPIGKGTIVLRNLEEYLEPRHIPWVHWTAIGDSGSDPRDRPMKVEAGCIT